MYKAVFLDRDGVVNMERGEYTYLLDDFVINNGVIDFCIEAIAKGYLILVISNQGGIAKGIYTLEQVNILHQFLEKELKKKGVKITDIYICPHHQDFGACLCRKPNSIMFEKAIAKYNIDKEKSIMFGDSKRDIIAAKKVGLEGILIEPNTDLRNYLELLT
jgi:D-glycero-D-manno-heptose 1,7-bisphosphate phosphatase